MELKLVYRSLRKTSEWMLDGYYSEISVEGKENMPKDGPVIVAATHHNEIIDIAALATTLPHRRHLSFWAKSTMFANPVMSAILSSSGAIPVRRNPNSSSAISTSSPGPSSSKRKSRKEDSRYSRSSLFESTSRTLASHTSPGGNEGVVGVFPEGTSYTQSSIAQVLPGVAWAAVEYVRWVRKRWDGVDGDAGYMYIQGGQRPKKYKGKARETAADSETGLKIIPVAIIYTDKANYLTRVLVRYGGPIHVDAYTKELFLSRSEDKNADSDGVARRVAKEMTETLEGKLHAMTINASDWDTLCAASVARNILWEDEDRIQMEEWVTISQRLVNLLELAPDTPPSHPISVLKQALSKYYALLKHTGMTHTTLASLLPFPHPRAYPSGPSSPVPTTFPILDQATTTLLPTLPVSLLQFALFLPPFVLHIPAYLTGYLAGRYLAPPDEEEAKAQFRAIGACLGLGASLTYTWRLIWRKGLRDVSANTYGDKLSLGVCLRLASVIYGSIWLIVRWHRLLVRPNYRSLQRLVTYGKLIYAFLFPSSSFSSSPTPWAERLRRQALVQFSSPPEPAENVYIKKRKLKTKSTGFAGHSMSASESLASSVASLSSASQSTTSLSLDETVIKIDIETPTEPTKDVPGDLPLHSTVPEPSRMQESLQPESSRQKQPQLQSIVFDNDLLDEERPVKMNSDVWSMLVREVVQARREACVALWQYLTVNNNSPAPGDGNPDNVKKDGHPEGGDNEEIIGLRMFLEARGARIPSVTWGW